MNSIRLLAAVLLPGLALAADWQVVPERSSLRFTGESQGEAFEGRFERFDASIRFDPAALDQARFAVDIELASADTQNEERDETLVGSDFFATASYPTARFEADDFVATDAGFEARGTLQLRGITRPVTLAFRWIAEGGGARLDGNATLDRLDFDVGTGDWADADSIAHAVKVDTTLMLTPRD